jgi:hypothetical protein
MGIRISVLAGLGTWLALAAGPAPVRADMVQFTYVGNVDTITTDGSTAPGIGPGEPFQGTFRYDSNASPIPNSSLSFPAFTSPGQLTLQVGRWDFHSDPAAPILLTYVGVLDPAQGGELELSSITVPDPGLFHPPASPGFLGIAFGNVAGPVPPATITAHPDQWLAGGVSLFLSFPKGGPPGDFADPRFTLQGTITSVLVTDPIATPEPSTLALAVAASLCWGYSLLRRNPARQVVTA